jgi:hypothetical protein
MKDIIRNILKEDYNKERILYHTSCNNFNEFHKDKINYFSLNEKDSVTFHNNWRICDDGSKGILYECKVDMGKVFNPNNLSEEEINRIEELVNNTERKSDLFMGDYGMKDYDFPEETTDIEFIIHMLEGSENWQVMEQPLFVKWMRENNYDSFIIKEYNFKDNSIGILNPNNIEIINKTQL